MSSKLKVNNIIPSTGTQIGISTTGGGINLLTGTVVTGIITASGFDGPITQSGDFTIDDWIVHAGDTNTKFGFLSNDVFEVHTAGSERIRVEADGHTQVGLIGLSGGNDHGLTVTEPGGTANVLELATGNATGKINFSRNLSSTLNTTSYIEWHEPGAQGTGSIRFGTSPSSNAPVERLEITSGGGLKFRSADSPANNSEPAQWLNHSGGMQLYGSSAEATHRNIIFCTNDRSAGERLRITSTGEIRIGGNEGGYKTTIIDKSNRTTTAETALLLYAKHDGTGTTGAGFGTGIRFWGDRASGNVEQNMGRIMCTAEVNSGTTLSGALSFETSVAGSLAERLRITSAGKVGIGTINPSGSLGVWDASGSDPTMSLHHSNADVEGEIIRIGRTDIPTIRYHSIKARHGGAATANFIKFHLHNGSSTTSQSEILRLEGDGDVTIPDGDLVIGTAGHGIDFSATSDATGKSSELLDDYEEGQWTPIIQFSNGGNTATYTSNRGGWYVKVGRLVTCNGRIEISAKGSGSSAVYFGGLPFTVGNHNSGTSGIEGGLTFSYVGNVNADKGSGMIGGYASENTTQAVPFYVDTSNNFHYVEDFDLESDASVGFVITYAV